MSIEAMKLALEALESSRVFVTTREKIKHPEGTDWYDERITALRQAIQQAEEQAPWDAYDKAMAEQAQPVAYGTWDTMIGYGSRMMMVRLDKGQDGCTIPLYTAPPPRQPWVGLSDEEAVEVMRQVPHLTIGGLLSVEAKLRSKNT